VNLREELGARLGTGTTTDKGWDNYKICPFCYNRNEKFGVHQTLLRYRCFRCGESGSLRFLLSHLGIDVVGPLKLRRRKVEKPSPFLSLGLDALGWHRLPCPEVGVVARAVEGYVRGRGVDLDLWEVGVCTAPDLFGRAVWLFRTAGEPVYFQARATDLTPSKRKAINPKPGAGCSRDRAVLGRDLFRPGMTLVAVEGPFDAAAVTDLERGRLGSPLLGNTASAERLQVWREMGVKEVVVMLDPEAEREAYDLVLKLDSEGFTASVVEWPESFRSTEEKMDPSSIGPITCQRLLDQVESLTPARKLLLRGAASQCEQQSRLKAAFEGSVQGRGPSIRRDGPRFRLV
jgi:hypothetical protein